MLNKKDKDNLIILGTLVAIIAICFASYHFTRIVAMKWIVLVYILATVVELGVISTKYLRVYGVESTLVGWVPIINCINTFPGGVAMALLIDCAALLTCLVLQFLPKDFLIKIMGAQTSMWFYDRLTFGMLLGMFAFFVIMGVGYSAIYRDVRKMVREATGYTSPKLECVNYPLFFFPLVATMGYASLITALNRLEAFNYSAVEVEENTSFREVGNHRDGTDNTN